MAYVAQQRLDGYDEAVRHALKWKAAFDKCVLQRHPGEVAFARGQLVQVYRNDLDYTFKTDRKLLPKWSQPCRVAEQLHNSYKIETLTGSPLSGLYHARRLRAFTPKEGSRLHDAQQAYIQQLREDNGTGSREGACGGEETSTLRGTEEHRGVSRQEEDDDENGGDENQRTEVYRDMDEQTEDGGRMDDEDPEMETDGDL